MERIPGLRVVGGASESEKEESKTKLESVLYEDHLKTLADKDREDVKKKEIKKTPVILEAIEFANRYTNRLREGAEVEPYTIPDANYHVLPPELYQKAAGKDSAGIALYHHQAILLDVKPYKNDPIKQALVVVHETLHLKGHIALEVEEKGSEKITSLFRAGISANASQKHKDENKDHVHFKGLHEGIVGELEKRAVPEVLKLDSLAGEVKRLSERPAQNVIEKISTEKKVPIDDIVWVSKDGKEYHTIGYKAQRDVLEYVCNEIYLNSNVFSSVDEVYELFFNAQFNGELLQISRFMKDTFGEIGFRTLSNMGSENNSAVLCLETLKKLRNN